MVPENPAYTVEQGTAVDSLTSAGRVLPLREAVLHSRTDGRLPDVYLSRGDAVFPGDRLADKPKHHRFRPTPCPQSKRKVRRPHATFCPAAPARATGQTRVNRDLRY
jgi:hypothetical protein